MEVDEPRRDEELDAIVEQLGMMGFDPSLAESLTGNLMAQILADQLIDKVKGLQEEIARSKRAVSSLTSRMAHTVCKRPTSPMPNSSDDEGRHPRKFREPDQG